MNLKKQNHEFMDRTIRNSIDRIRAQKNNIDSELEVLNDVSNYLALSVEREVQNINNDLPAEKTVEFYKSKTAYYLQVIDALYFELDKDSDKINKIKRLLL